MCILLRGEDGKRKNRARTLEKAARCQPAKAFGNGEWLANRFRLVYISPRVLIYSRGAESIS
jgi:hypothetical protein